MNKFFLALNVITILSNTKYCKISFVWSAVPVIKWFSKGQNANILNILHVLPRQFRAVLVDINVPETVPRCYTKRFCCKKCHPSWFGLNETFLRWSFFFLSARSRAVLGQLCLHETIDYSVSNCFMNIKMKSNIMNVEISFHHANHSAAFVSGRLLRIHIPKFHQISVTSWCLHTSDLLNTS